MKACYHWSIQSEVVKNKTGHIALFHWSRMGVSTIPNIHPIDWILRAAFSSKTVFLLVEAYMLKSSASEKTE